MEYNDSEYFCNKCIQTFSTKQKYIQHLATKKHNINKETFYCDLCVHQFSSKQKYIQHLSSKKHNKFKIIKTVKCESKSMTTELGELRKTVIELSKNIHSQNCVVNNNSNNTNNSFNKTFNLQVFLNETCKDALNIGEFIDNIKVSLQDLEGIGNKGYVKGISNIIIKNLSDLDETKRPVHCSDVKRETIYVKDNDAWEKEHAGHPKIVNAVKHISSKSIGQLKPWRDANPGFDDPNSRASDTYQTLICESCESNDTVESKIVRHVAKTITIPSRNIVIDR